MRAHTLYSKIFKKNTFQGTIFILPEAVFRYSSGGGGLIGKERKSKYEESQWSADNPPPSPGSPLNRHDFSYICIYTLCMIVLNISQNCTQFRIFNFFFCATVQFYFRRFTCLEMVNNNFYTPLLL